MITKIQGEAPFQVLTNNFSISPSNEGYTLQISADGVNYSNLFSVAANTTRLVTGVAANSYYRLLGNNSDVVINWSKSCVSGGGDADLTNYYTKDEVDEKIEEAVTSGVSLDGYWTSGETQTAIASAVTYLESEIPDVRDFVTSGDVESQIEDSLSGYATEEWVEDQGYLTEHQSLSAYSTTQQVEDMIASAKTEIEAEIPDVRDFVTSGDVESQIADATEDFVTYDEADEMIAEAIENIDVPNPNVLKHIVVGSDWRDETVISDYNLEPGDVVAIAAIDPELGFEWNQYDDNVPKTYVNESEYIQVNSAEFADTVNGSRSAKSPEPVEPVEQPTLEFWFGTSKKYDEGDCYRCYWDEDESEWLIESTNGASTEGLYVEWSEDDGQYILKKSNVNSNLKAPAPTTDVMFIEETTYDTGEDLMVEGWTVGLSDQLDSEYFITKVNDSLYVEGLGAITEAGTYQVSADMSYLNALVDSVSFNDTLASNYYTKEEVNAAIAASGGTVDLSAYWTSGETQTNIDTAISGVNETLLEAGIIQINPETSAQTINSLTDLESVVETNERVISIALNELHTNISGMTASMVTSDYTSGHRISSIWQGSKSEYDILTESGATADGSILYIIKNNGQQ